MFLFDHRSNQQIYDELSKLVIGHDHAKKVLINIVNRSKLRYYQKWGLLEENLINLSNCLLIGDSGTGKTFLIETLSQIMDFPFIKIDATELNPTGASGGIKKKDLINKIINKVQELKEDFPERYWSLEGTLDQMVVFVDEIDKLGQQLSTDWNEHVQANFLTLFENKGELSNITYIFAGAFSTMDKYEKDKPPIGFSKNTSPLSNQASLAEKIIKFGLIPELVGRMQHIILLDKLTENEYRKILLSTILPKIKESLEFMSINDFDLTTDQINELIAKTIKSGLGVRALEAEVNRLLIDVEFNAEIFKDLSE